MKHPKACDDHVSPDGPALALLHQVWSEEQKHTLGTYGIFLPMIKEAYRHLAQLEAIAFRRFSSSGEQEAAIMQVVEWCRLPRYGRLGGRASGGEAARIVIAGNTEDPEALCVCEVVREMVQVRVQVVVEVVHSTQGSSTHLQSADY